MKIKRLFSALEGDFPDLCLCLIAAIIVGAASVWVLTTQMFAGSFA